MQRMGWKKIGPDEQEQIEKTVCLQTDFILDSYAKRSATETL
jgi:hypothetical protein